MIRQIFWEVAAFCALLWLATYGTRALLSLENRVKVAEAQVAALAMPMTSPIRCDATTQQCGTTFDCKKPKCYVRKESK